MECVNRFAEDVHRQLGLYDDEVHFEDRFLTVGQLHCRRWRNDVMMDGVHRCICNALFVDGGMGRKQHLMLLLRSLGEGSDEQWPLLLEWIVFVLVLTLLLLFDVVYCLLSRVFEGC